MDESGLPGTIRTMNEFGEFIAFSVLHKNWLRALEFFWALPIKFHLPYNKRR
jgi:hypothetical protein